MILRLKLVLVLVLVVCGRVTVAQSTPGEKATLQAWIAKHIAAERPEPPFSFRVGDLASTEFLARCNFTHSAKILDEARTEHQLNFTDDTTGLQVRCKAIEYRDFPNVEWTLYFKNEGDTETPILSQIRALDVTINREGDSEFVLHHYKGSRAEKDDFRPRATTLEEGVALRFRSLGGRGTNGTMPYFNLQGPTKGVITAIGWPGQWDATFERDETTKLRVSGGQEVTHFKLLPGEEVRSPLIVVQFYEGEPRRGQNLWRRWMVRHNLPRVEGKLQPTQLVACSSHQFGEMINANEENQKLFIDRYAAEKLGIAYWWMDAGWYVNDGTWVNTGTWEVDRKRFPNGLRAITDHGRTKGINSIVWFEPERVTAGSWLYEQHPEWLLTAPKNPGDQLYDEKWRLLNLGNPTAFAWLVDHVGKIIKDEGINLYRQDFNIDPLEYWNAADAKDRQGITEIKYVTGYLAYWDALLNQHPGLRIDTCASGGRRLDLETLRRSAPLVRSDCLFEPISQQCHTYGIADWLPYHGTGTLIGKSAIGQNTTEQLDPYDFRSHMACSVTACWDMRDKNLDYDKLRKLTGQLREVSPNYLADFYPLTPYSLQPDAWIAWQYDNPEKGTGVVHAFRRDQNQESTHSLQLRGLDRDTKYVVKNLDEDSERTLSGAELADKGLSVELTNPRSAAVISYRKAE